VPRTTPTDAFIEISEGVAALGRYGRHLPCCTASAGRQCGDNHQHARFDNILSDAPLAALAQAFSLTNL
jgi:hypothetical protein